MNKKTLGIIIAMVLLVAVLAGVYFATRPQATEGQKTFTLVITHKDGSTKEQTFTTEAYREFFRDGRMDDGSEFGYRITVVSIDQDANGEYTATVRIEKE